MNETQTTTPASVAPVDVNGTSAGDHLEELTLPSLVTAPEPLAADTEIGPNGQVRIGEHLGVRGRINRYRAIWSPESGEPVTIELREGPADQTGLQQEDEILSAVQYAMLPKRYLTFAESDRRYLALDPFDGETLADALQSGLTTDQSISIGLQLAQLVRRVHQAGWALLGLAPADIAL